MSRPPDLKDIDGQIEQLKQEKEAAVAEQDFEKAAHLRDQADKLKKKKEQVTRDWREKSKEIDGIVDEEVIAEVVSKMTGVPLKRMEEKEKDRLLKMEDELHKAVVSQHEAIHAIAKAHPDVWNMLLQIMEEGRLTDNVGRTVDFKNSILIMTTNIGAEQIIGKSQFGFTKKDAESTYEKMKETLKQAMEQNFRPEF